MRKPYKVICISLYEDDLERLDEKVELLKARGHRRANRSELIRFALGRVNPEEIALGLSPRGAP